MSIEKLSFEQKKELIKSAAVQVKIKDAGIGGKLLDFLTAKPSMARHAGDSATGYFLSGKAARKAGKGAKDMSDWKKAGKWFATGMGGGGILGGLIGLGKGTASTAAYMSIAGGSAAGYLLAHLAMKKMLQKKTRGEQVTESKLQAAEKLYDVEPA